MRLNYNLLCLWGWINCYRDFRSGAGLNWKYIIRDTFFYGK